MVEFSSFALGAVVGLIAAAIFAVILRRHEQEPRERTISALWRLSALALGGGMGDYVIFDYLMKANGALVYYVSGFSIVFLVLGIAIYFDWRR